MDPQPTLHPRAAFFYPNFRLYSLARFLVLCAHQMMAVGLGQYVYERTHNPLHLGYIGLALFVPKIAFTLIAGHTSDRFDRVRVILVCRSTQLLITLGLFLFTFFNYPSLWILYGLLFLLGSANTFDGPANQSLLPQLVEPHHFSNAVAWNASVMQIAFILGPALGGAIYAFSGRVIEVILAIALFRFLSLLLVSRMKTKTHILDQSQISWNTLMAGVRYIFEKKIILGAISLDLFAVLLGGAVALLPIYANTILNVGPSGLGLLRAAPSVGAALMAIAIAHRPPMMRAGTILLISVAIFGLFTLFFGLSQNFIFSLFCLFILGAADMISVVIRGVLVQMKTPSDMRGRVSAVNLIFIGASNELGEFESGLTAAWFGVVPAVVLGGIGTLAVVAIWAWRFPELRRYGGSA